MTIFPRSYRIKNKNNSSEPAVLKKNSVKLKFEIDISYKTTLVRAKCNSVIYTCIIISFNNIH